MKKTFKEQRDICNPTETHSEGKDGYYLKCVKGEGPCCFNVCPHYRMNELKAPSVLEGLKMMFHNGGGTFDEENEFSAAFNEHDCKRCLKVAIGCRWSYDPADEGNSTSCGHKIQLLKDVDWFKYCPACGKKIVQCEPVKRYPGVF